MIHVCWLILVSEFNDRCDIDIIFCSDYHTLDAVVVSHSSNIVIQSTDSENHCCGGGYCMVVVVVVVVVVVEGLCECTTSAEVLSTAAQLWGYRKCRLKKLAVVVVVVV